MARSGLRTLRHLTLTLGGLALLAPQPASADAGGDCSIRRAEATICPAFHRFGDDERPEAISGDASTVVGSLVTADGGTRPVRWVDGVRRELPGLPDVLFGRASATSRDGSVIAGTVYTASPPFDSFTYRWKDGVFEVIDDIVGFPQTPTDMSGDGRVIVTVADSDGGRWVEGGSLEIWKAPGLDYALPYGISDDGSVIVGTNSFGDYALQWVGDVTTLLQAPEGGFPEGSGAIGISPDGSVIVGTVGWGQGAVWRDGVFEAHEFTPIAASWNGFFLVGASRFEGPSGTSIELASLLAELGVEIPAAPRSVSDMSDDGHVLIGTLVDGGRYQAVVSPKLGMDVQPGRRFDHVDLAQRLPLVVRLFGSEQADVATIDPQQLWLGPARANPIEARPPRDRNGDGHADRDFLFDVSTTGLAAGDEQACLAGVIEDLPFRLCSPVRVTLDGCGRGAELALLLPLAVILRRRTRRPPAASPAAR